MWVYNPKTNEWCVTQKVIPTTGDEDEGKDGRADGGNINEGNTVGGTVPKDDDRYTSHRLCPTDTFQGLCLKVRTSTSARGYISIALHPNTTHRYSND